MIKTIIGISIMVAGVMIIFSINQNSQNLSLTPGAGQIDKWEITLVTIEPEVFAKRPQEENFAAVAKEEKVSRNTDIKTSSKGRALLKYPDGKVAVIENNTEIKISDLAASDNQSRLSLIRGAIWSKIERILQSGEYYEIETENMLAAIRGTIFAVEFENNLSIVYALENNVAITAFEPKTKELMADVFVLLNEGEKIKIDSSRLPSPDQPLKKELITKEDLERPVIKNNLTPEITSRPAIKKLLQKLGVFSSPELSSTPLQKPLLSPIPVPSPTKILITKTPIPMTEAPISKEIPSPITTFSPTPRPTSIPTPLPTTQVPAPTLISGEVKISLDPKISLIEPNVLYKPLPLQASYYQTQQMNFYIYGENLLEVKEVLIGENKVQFKALDNSSILVIVSSEIKSGVYNVSLIAPSGKIITSPMVLEIYDSQ